MSPVGQVLIGLAMAIGLIGTLIPVLPGLILMWLAGLVWVILDGPDKTHWLLFALMTVFFVVGLALSMYLPAKSVADSAPPKWTLICGSAFAVIGFFLIPVVGAPLGFALGVFLRILIHGREFHLALGITGRTLKALGFSAIVQCMFGIAIATVWALGLIIVN
ncbi:MAG: DUF456 family protein [Actinomycetales bacterium]|nr:DUF456 family protein [Actinomycetales bacterium]